MLRKRPALLWLALVRFGEARALHVHAMRVRSSEALHDVRIGVKRLRYTLESLLPEQHSTVSKLLKKLQDVLGDLHDLDVATAFLHSLPDTNDADLARLVDKRAALLASYKAMATGRAAVWNTLRAVLPTRTDAIARCQRAALIELACAYGADSRSIRRGEAIARAIAKATNTTLDDAQRAAVVLVAAKKPRRRARQMLGASPEQIKAVRRALKSNVVKAVAAAAAR